MAIWHYDTRRIGASILAPGGYAYDYRSHAYAPGAGITTLSAPMSPGATLTINLTGYTAVPDTITYGGVAMTINSATVSAASITVPARSALSLLWGAPHTLSVQSSGETTTTSRVLNPPSGWAFINLGSVPDSAFDSLYRARSIDSTDPFTAEVGDQFRYETRTGLLFTPSTVIFLETARAPVTFLYSVFDVSLVAIRNEHSLTIEVADGTPTGVSFTDQLNTIVNSLYTSNTITPTGYNTPVLVTISGDGTPQFSINGGAYTSDAAIITPGQTLVIRNISSATASAIRLTTITVGGVPYAWSIANMGATGDTTPNAFSFTPVTGAALSATVESNTITVTGIDVATPISITGGGMSINGSSFISGATAITNGQTVRVAVITSGSYNTPVTATLSIGLETPVTANFVATTLVAPDTTPTSYNFNNISGQALNTVVVSNVVTISGINTPSLVTIAGEGNPAFSINGGTFSASPRNITNGQTLQLRLTTAGLNADLLSVSVTVGTLSDAWDVTTVSAVADAEVNFRLYSTQSNTVANQNWEITVFQEEDMTNILVPQQVLASTDGYVNLNTDLLGSIGGTVWVLARAQGETNPQIAGLLFPEIVTDATV